jgi:protein-S-isoprenylcysteine O-methyltransferase Ste14
MSAHTGFYKTSDFILISTILPALILDFIFPFNIGLNRSVSLTVGIILIIVSWTIIIIAKYQFNLHKQRSGPGHETTIIIKNGLFAYTRNPIYLGVIIIAFAIGLIVNSSWLLLAVIPLILLLKNNMIMPEEKYLRDKFKEEYIEYCKKVRRWV